MAIVGSATVVIRAITDKLESDIQAGLQRAAANSGGSDFGKRFSDDFNKNFNIDVGSGGFDSVTNDAEKAGREAGDELGKGIDKGMEDGVKDGANKIVRESKKAGNDGGNALKKLFSGSGASKTFVSMALRIAALVPVLGALGGAISSVISGLFAMGAAAANAVYAFSPLPGIVGALIQGGGALMLAFSGVGDALSASTKATDAATKASTQGFKASTKTAYDYAEAVRDAKEAISDAREGIRDAIESESDAVRELTRTEQDSANKIVDAQTDVREARERVAAAVRGVADTEIQSLEDVSDAELALTRAQKRARDAQQALTDARHDAQEQLEDLQFAARQGAISEAEAVMKLDDAKKMLAATSNLPADSRTRQNAVLGYQEAQLALDRTRDANEDNADALEKARNAGIEGSQQVVAAQNEITDAQINLREATEAATKSVQDQVIANREANEELKDSQVNLKRMRQELRNAFVDGPEAIRDAKEAISDASEAVSDARENLRDAIHDLADAQKAQANPTNNLAAAAQNAQIAMSKLSPAAQEFVKYLISIKGRLQDLKFAAQEGLFPGLQKGLETLVNGPLFPALETAIGKSAKAVGDSAARMGAALSTGPFVATFGRVTDDNAKIITVLGGAVTHLVKALFSFMDAARPVTDELVNWFGQWSRNIAVNTQAADSTGKLTDKLVAGADQMKQLIRIIKNIAEGFFDLGTTASDSGQTLLDSFEKATKKFADFTDNAKNVQMLKTYFADVATNLQHIGDLSLTIGGAFARLGANPEIAKLADQLRPVVKQVEDLINTMLAQSGGKIVELLSAVIEAFKQISESDSIGTFLTILTTAVNVLVTALQTPVLGSGLKLLLQIGAAMYALSILRKFPVISQLSSGLGFFVKKNDEGLRGLGRLKKGIKEMSDNASEGYYKFRSSVAKIGPAISNTAKSAVDSAKLLGTRLSLAVGRAQTVVANSAKSAASAVRSTISSAATGAANLAKAVGRVTKALFEQAIQAVKTAAVWVWQKTVAAATRAWAAAQWLLNAAMDANPIGLVVIAIAALVGGFILAYKKSETFRNIVNGVFDAVKTAASEFANFFTSTIPNAIQYVVDFLQEHWKLILGIIGGPLVAAIILVTTHWDTIKGIFNSVVDWVQRVFAGAWNVVKDKIINPIGNAVDAVGNFFGEGGPLRTKFNNVKDWVVNAFSKGWQAVKGVVTSPISDAVGAIGSFFGEGGPVRSKFTDVKNWVTNVFSNAWNSVKSTLMSPLNDARDAISNLLGEKGPIRGFFTDFVAGINVIWDGLKAVFKDPIKFIVTTVLNNGLIAAVNHIPGVNIKDVELPKGFAKGGVLPGFTPGRDVHKFWSPTGGGLELSGGEAIMRPEFTRAIGGREGVDNLNRLAISGKLNPIIGHADGGVITVDGEPFTTVAAKQLALAEHLSGVDMRIIQGSYQQASSYSGTTHTGGGVADIAPGSFDTQSWLRKVAFAAWARNIPGAAYAGSGAHVHSVSMIDPLQTESAARAQVAAYRAGGDGLGGSDYGPRPAVLPNLAQLLGTSSVSSDAPSSGGVLGKIGNVAGSVKDAAADATKAIVDKFTGPVKAAIEDVNKVIVAVKSFAGSPMGAQFVGVAEKVGNDLIQYVNDKIPNRGLPDNPIPPLAFDQGGVASGTGWMRKDVVEPERVLSPRQTEGFDRLIAALENTRSGSGGSDDRVRDLNITMPVNEGTSAREAVDNLVYEIRRLEKGGKYV